MKKAYNIINFCLKKSTKQVVFFYLIFHCLLIQSQNLNKQLPSHITQVEIILLMGQSNMKGRGKIIAEQTINPNIILMNMTNDKWYPAIHPLHITGVPDLLDKSSKAGFGPGLDFAEALIKKNNSTLVALIPLAKGGSWIDLWSPEKDLYKETIRRTKKALNDFPKEVKVSVKAALWLQGESDAKGDRYMVYEKKLKKIVKNLRLDLDAPNLPFISATIGTFMEGISHKYPYYNEINNILLNAGKNIDNYGCVDARLFGKDRGDHIHYNTASLQEIGKRYAEIYFNIVNKD